MDKPVSYTEARPWGSFTKFVENTPATVKLIRVNQGAVLSLQSHAMRSELWVVVAGEFWITIGDTVTRAGVGSEHWIPQAAKHRMEGIAEKNVILEVALGEFDENDIVRYEDKYGRT